MGTSYYYQPGPDGRHYCYDSTPTFRCPMSNLLPADERVYVVPRAVNDAADALGVDGDKLTRLLVKAHRSISGGRERVDGKLTNYCAICGHKMERLGFRYWIEAKPGASASSEQRTSAAISQRLGGSGFVQVDGSWYQPTKRAAQDWAQARVAAVSA